MALKSTVWDYFIRTSSDKVKCNVCSAVLSARDSSTSNMNRHFRLKHPTLNLKESRSRPSAVIEEEVTNAARMDINRSLPIADEVAPQASSSASASTATMQRNTKQSTISAFAVKPMSAVKREKIDEQLLTFIIKGYHAFNMVECPEFKRFCYLLNHNYDTPSRKTLSNSLLSKVFDRTLSEVRNDIATNASFISLTTDGWTSIKHESFFAVTAHFIDRNYCLKSYLLSCFKFSGQHTAENIAQELRNTAKVWDIQHKIVACTTDNAANMVKAVQLCNWWHVPCFAHSLNLVVQNSLELIAETRSKVRSVVEHFKRSPQALEKLHNIQRQLGYSILTPKQECPTRWNSTFEMFQRLLSMKEPLQSAMAILNSETVQKLSNEDWHLIEKCTEALASFEEVTKEVSSERSVSLSKLMLLSKGLYSHCLRLKDTNKTVEALTARLADEVLRRLIRKYGDLAIVWEATLLDARFKYHGFSKDDQRFKQTKEAIINKCCAARGQEKINTVQTAQETAVQPCTSSVWQDFDVAVGDLLQPEISNPRTASIVEVDKFLNMPLLPRAGNPLLWWKEHSEIFPVLSKLMKRRLCIMATSVPCERIFSKQGQTITERRAQLSSKKVSKLMFLNFNLKT